EANTHKLEGTSPPLHNAPTGASAKSWDFTLLCKSSSTLSTSWSGLSRLSSSVSSRLHKSSTAKRRLYLALSPRRILTVPPGSRNFISSKNVYPRVGPLKPCRNEEIDRRSGLNLIHGRMAPISDAKTNASSSS